jgi:hypothetical protein
MKKNFGGKTKFSVLLFMKANSYRKQFSDASQLLTDEIKGLVEDIDSIAPEPPVKLPTIAKIFWNNNFENQSILWDIFMEKYKFENNIDNENINNFKKYLCLDNKYVTEYAFYSTCSQFGYPIMLSVQVDIDTIKLAELIMKLNKEFYDPIEIGQYWAKITNLKYNYKKKEDLEEYLKTIKENKEEWLQLNISRDIISSLFQRYMMLWRIGKSSQKMFDNVDFPGKSRIKTFIYVCESIDKVNYEHLGLQQDKNWEKGRPQVYDFLRAVLNNK